MRHPRPGGRLSTLTTMSANAELSRIFKEMAVVLELTGANPFRVNAHTRVARALGDLKAAHEMLESALPEALEGNLSALAADMLLEQAHLARENGKVERACAKAKSAAEQYKVIGAAKGEQEAAKLILELNGKVHACCS